ncbi:hypothetical protein AAMO2058_001487900 [Amorphochlora amoebiformis]
MVRCLDAQRAVEVSEGSGMEDENVKNMKLFRQGIGRIVGGLLMMCVMTMLEGRYGLYEDPTLNIKTLHKKWKNIYQDIQSSELLCTSSTDHHPHIPKDKCLYLAEETLQGVVHPIPFTKETSHQAKKGKGIVFTGRSSYLRNIYASISILHSHGSTLEIEIFTEDETSCLAIQMSFKTVKCRIMTLPRGFLAKIYALKYTRFRHVLFLDHDNIPLRDPSILFLSKNYISTGAIFWPDVIGASCMDGNSPKVLGWTGRKEHVIWKSLGLEWKDEWKYTQEVESGQLILDVERHWEAILEIERCVRNPFMQYILYGDKDCFRLIFLHLNLSFELVENLPSLILENPRTLKDGEVEYHRKYIVSRYHFNDTSSTQDFFLHWCKEKDESSIWLLMRSEWGKGNHMSSFCQPGTKWNYISIPKTNHTSDGGLRFNVVPVSGNFLAIERARHQFHIALNSWELTRPLIQARIKDEL